VLFLRKNDMVFVYSRFTIMHNIPIRNLTIADFIGMSGPKTRLYLEKSAGSKINRVASSLQKLIGAGKIIYGVNTGVGDLCDVTLQGKDLYRLQENIILSHACGSSPYLEERVSRGALFLIINSRSKGFSGVTAELIRKLVILFNNNVSPLLPVRGSLGASGDLIPMAHLGLLLLGQGSAMMNGKIVPTKKILHRLRISNHVLQPKEALSLINGTDVTTAQAAFTLEKAKKLLFLSARLTAVIFEVLGASKKSLDSDLHSLKPHVGQVAIARLLRKFLHGSRRCDRPNKKIQASYVIRCAPQIDGAIWEQIEKARDVAEVELNSVTDNPLFFPSGAGVRVASGGNFHAQNLAFSLDSAGIALAAFGKVVERRIERLLNSSLSGLPPFLAHDFGLNSGLMIPQYLVAALVAENLVLAHPASIQSLPVSANQEDFVSMAMTAATKAEKILENCEKILAVEILTAIQAMDMAKDANGRVFSDFSPAAKTLHRKTRAIVSELKNDRWLSKDIEVLTESIQNGYFHYD